MTHNHEYDAGSEASHKGYAGGHRPSRRFLSNHLVLGAIAGVSIAALALTIAVPPRIGAGSGSATTGNIVATDLAAAENAGYLAASGANASDVDAGATGGHELPKSIADGVPDSATLVSESYAVTTDGEVLDVATGDEVTDPAIVGTEDTPPDPMALTGGVHYAAISVGDAREEIADDSAAGTADSAVSADGIVDVDGTVTATAAVDTATGAATAQNTALSNNAYGAYWGISGNQPAIFNANGSVAVANAKGVIDVSAYQRTIDWSAAKAAGVEGAIIRVGYGVNYWDSTAAYNIQQCKKLGIPFGIYWYSYADTATMATEEGQSLATRLAQLGVSPTDLSYPVYYDIEAWKWSGHTQPTSPAVYDTFVGNFISAMNAAGYSNVSLYTYLSFANTVLNDSYLHGLITWMAQYSSTLQYTDWGKSTNGYEYKGWQYSDSGQIGGISGNVDMSAFTGVSATYRLYNPNSGEHFYTQSVAEREALVRAGWAAEGTAWTSLMQGTEVHRLYSPESGDHHYSMDSHEISVLTGLGWQDEGLAWYSGGSVPVYRAYNPNAFVAAHVYSTQYSEIQSLAKNDGWRDENLAWWALTY
ncbi:glycosyl hydrolase family 25 [Pseudoscardovia radai]|uniref:Glycosyl hydrolase family 25 n=1 Tax=Pseudoscardovia radai TaxID=987066 RepID=A0A261EZQ5_9BIFI|nr:glycoside hydrolase family 25 protein [Pseudoscardovia radai]OZG52327.1 glycosyl hydrolase family 25 [Pseudoscardovia radai]